MDKGTSNAILKARKNAFGIYFTDRNPCVGGKIEFATTKVSLEQNFHLKYFFKLFIPFSGVYLCISF